MLLTQIQEVTDYLKSNPQVAYKLWDMLYLIPRYNKRHFRVKMNAVITELNKRIEHPIELPKTLDQAFFWRKVIFLDLTPEEELGDNKTPTHSRQKIYDTINNFGNIEKESRIFAVRGKELFEKEDYEQILDFHKTLKDKVKDINIRNIVKFIKDEYNKKEYTYSVSNESNEFVSPLKFVYGLPEDKSAEDYKRLFLIFR